MTRIGLRCPDCGVQVIKVIEDFALDGYSLMANGKMRPYGKVDKYHYYCEKCKKNVPEEDLRKDS